MKQLHLKPMKSLADVEQGVAELENSFHECALAVGTVPTDRELKDDFLAILPENLQTDLFWNASGLSMSFSNFQDLVVTQPARVLAPAEARSRCW